MTPRSPDDVRAGEEMHRLATELFPICRSITGNGVRETLKILGAHVPLTIHEVPSGTKVLDWTVPPEWNIRDAYVLDDRGERIIDFQKSNLHVVAYSAPVNKTVTLAELQQHLFSLEDQPDAVPYITSFYEEFWGFCLSHRQRMQLKEGNYRVVVDSEFSNGSLTYGELVIPGSSRREVFLSTYICHPSMANNELSGPVVATYLAKWVARAPRRYTYRFIFIPETIGSITYLSSHAETLKANVAAGFNLTCIGDDRAYSFLPSRNGSTLADRVALNVLTHSHPDFIRYTFLDRGSDERQYCSPGVDLPVVSIMRSKYREFPEYHTSLDDLHFVTPSGLAGGYGAVRDCLALLEQNRVYRATCLGEPQLGRRGLYPRFGTKESHDQVKEMLDLLVYADGTNDLIALSDLTRVPVARLLPIVDQLLAEGLLKAVETGAVEA